MKSFSSSVINKSGKKFAPKAPVRRAAPAPPRAHSRRPSVVSQTASSHLPATESETATPEPPVTTTSNLESPAPSEPTVPESSLAVPTVEHAPKDKLATAIPIPRPKRKASFSVPIPRPTKDVPTPSHSSPQQSTTTPVEAIAWAPDWQSELREAGEANSDAVQNQVEPATRAVAAHNEITPEIRPSKRPRTTVEAASTAPLAQPAEEASQFATMSATQPSALDERRPSLAEPESQSATRPGGSTARPDGRRLSRSASNSNDTGQVPKKERKRRTRKREPTPEGAELIEIAPAVVKMSDLCKDMRTGKRSKRETELRAHEFAEAERRKAQQEARPERTPVKQTPNEASPPTDLDKGKLNKKSQAGPVMRIVNGEIVLDTASLQVDRHADAERNGGDLEDVIENSLTRKINQATYGKRSKTESWDEDMTELFYRGLRIFGTDFMVISKLFPGRSRRQIKLKFNNEERRDPQRIKETLMGPRETIDINTYSEMTQTVYDDPRVIEQELDEEKRRIEEQHERDKRTQEDLLRNPDGLGPSDSPSVDKIPTKGKRNNKKQLERDLGGGTEEIVGSLDD
ncbi:transcription factor TFIIIB subunit BDP1 [Aspergillus lucknowensis]|uniref:Myb-like domain-containing protein n=1 Tax=Aspergillus lucknowensis TaxID=176173 RepID=A0ABR4M3X5_9EURO